MAAMAPPSPIVAVVGPQFCAPYVVALTITKKAISLSDGDFIVADAHGTVLMKICTSRSKFHPCNQAVRGGVLSLRSRRVLCNADGVPIISTREKVISMHSRWQVYRGDSNDQGDLLFSVKKSHVLQLKTELDIFLSGNTAQRCCDFKVKGSWFDRSCTFYLGESNTIIALMSRQ